MTLDPEFKTQTSNLIKDTMLLYPKHIYDVDDALTLGKEETIVDLKMKSIDLNCEDTGYENYIEEIKNRLEKINEI